MSCILPFFNMVGNLGNQLMLNEDLSRAWDVYVLALRRAHICLGDSDDVLIWDKSLNGVHSPKVGYIAISAELFLRDVKWWWKGLWKLNCPVKNKFWVGMYLKTRF